MSKTLTLLALVTAFSMSTSAHAIIDYFLYSKECRTACNNEYPNQNQKSKKKNCLTRCANYQKCLKNHPDGKQTGTCPKFRASDH